MGTLVAVWPELQDVSPNIAQQVEHDARYQVYLSRQSAIYAVFEPRKKKSCQTISTIRLCQGFHPKSGVN